MPKLIYCITFVFDWNMSYNRSAVILNTVLVYYLIIFLQLQLIYCTTACRVPRQGRRLGWREGWPEARRRPDTVTYCCSLPHLVIESHLSPTVSEHDKQEGFVLVTVGKPDVIFIREHGIGHKRTSTDQLARVVGYCVRSEDVHFGTTSTRL